MALKRRAVSYEKLDLLKMDWLARHDGTSSADQFRMAVRRYLHARKRTVYAVNGTDPLNDPPGDDPATEP